MLAVYNDMAFLPSIGEITVATGDYEGEEVLEASKPGTFVTFDEDLNPIYTHREGWASAEDRAPGFLAGLLVREWDSWDQELLRNTKSRLKSLFKTYYYSRDFEDNLNRILKTNPAPAHASKLMQNLFPNMKSGMLKRWQKKLQRSNPFEINGNLMQGREGYFKD